MVLSFILNLPYTFIGLIMGFISLPTKVEFSKNPYTIILKVKRLWWGIGYLKSVRATTFGNVVLLSAKAEYKDLEHELVHVGQYQREPLIHPILYFFEQIKNGYRNNKYEVEAYEKAGNNYYEK